MTEQEIRLYLSKELTLSKIKDFNTTIIIGNAAKVFKKMIRSGFYTITTADEVREFLNKWSQVPLDSPLVFEDISLMTTSVQSFLLKFIEEPPAPLIILASIDNVSPIILSRCKRIIKLPEDFKIGQQSLNEFITNKHKAKDEITVLKSEGKDIPDDLQDFFSNIEKKSLECCPDYLYFSTLIKDYNIYNPDTYLELL